MLARSFFLHIVPLAWLLSVRPAHVAHADDADSCAQEASQGNALLSVKAETVRKALSKDEAVQDIFADLHEDSDSHAKDDDDDKDKATTKSSNTSNTSWQKVNQTIRDLVNNVLVADINQTHQLPDPEGNYSDPQNRSGLGKLAQTLEFLYLKVAELETAVELQNIEIQLNHEQAQLDIQQLKDRLDQKDADLRQLHSKLRQHAAERKHHDADVALVEDQPAALLHRHRKAWQDKTHERRQQRQQRLSEGAHSILRRVLQKHHRQSDKKDWSSDRPALSHDKQTSHVAKDGGVDLRQELAQRAANNRKSQRGKELDSSISAKGPIDVISDTAGDVADGAGDLASDVADTATDVATHGNGLVGDALTDAYKAAADKVSFVADTVIDTVEQAIAILTGGFDFSAGCPHWTWPTLDVSTTGISVGFGRQSCEVVLVGQRLSLFDFNWGTLSVNYPRQIAAMVAMGNNLVNCISDGGPAFDVFKCVATSIGETLLQVVPPFSILTQLSRMLEEFLAFFAQLASAAITAALDDTTALVQEAATVSTFPAHGQPARLVSSRRGISAHIRRQKSVRKVPKTASSFVQEKSATHSREEPDDTMATGAIGFATTEAMPYASMLITQFGGDEFDSGSCLGFAPKHRTGSNGKVTQRDWQVPSPDSADFVKLEPWAVPCSNQWAKDHPEKWEGYSFYTYESVIEKCVAISYSMSVQPTLAFVGGLEFELMPAPLAEVTTEVCWPDRVSAPDLSLIITTIRTGGIVLFKHTIRLHKRFGSDTGFTAGNIKDAVERARNYFGKGTNDDDDKSLQGMPRSVLSQVENSTESTSETGTDEETHFHPEQEEIFLASAKYDAQLGVNLTHRFSGHEAHARVRAAMRPRKLGALQQDEAEQGLGRHELFELSSPSKSLVGFSVIGELESGVMQLKLQMQFGPIPSPEKTIPLLDLADHLRITLAAIPFISQASKQKAVDAFSSTDLEPYIPPTHVLGPLPLTNGWADWGSGYSSPTYVLAKGLCSVQALVKGSAGFGQIATLPQECRPSGTLIFNLNSGNSVVRVDVKSEGQVVWVAGNAGGTWLSLTGILFPPQGGWPVPLLNSWVDYDANFAPATYKVVGGLCILSGLIKGGSWGQFGTLPEECRPQHRRVFNMNMEDATMRVDVAPDGWVGYVAGSTALQHASLSGIVFSVDDDQTFPLKLGSSVWDYGGGYSSPTYSIVDGLCIMEGLISYSSMTSYQTLAYLPVECWPIRALSFSVNQQDMTPRVQVFPNGEVQHVGGASSSGWLSLSGIAFAPATGGRRMLPYRNSWKDYGYNFGEATFSMKNGFCILEGMVWQGDWDSSFALLPEGCRPTKRLLFHANNHEGSSRVDVETSGGVLYVAGPTNNHWMSVSGIVFAPDTVGHIALPLAGAWVGYGGAYESPDYTVRNGICSVEGLIYGGEWGHLATLPEDCRPADGALIFTVNNHAKPARVNVESNGEIRWVAGGNNHHFISLSGIVFSPTAVGYAIPLENGWSNYGKGYAPAKYRVVNGICFLEGLISKGSATHAATLPSDCRPKKTLVFDSNKQDNIDRVDVDVNGAVMFFDLNPGGWASLSGVLFDVE